MIGRTYLEAGDPVVVLARWRHARPAAGETRHGSVTIAWAGKSRGGPRNVLIRREDGEAVVRPFRGLRKP